MKISTSTQYKENSVGEMIAVLKQADQESVVTNEHGKPVSAYIDVIGMKSIIVEADV